MRLFNAQSGMLRTKRGDYYIEPSKHHKVNDAGHYPHIVFQRSAIKVSSLKAFISISWIHFHSIFFFFNQIENLNLCSNQKSNKTALIVILKLEILVVRKIVYSIKKSIIKKDVESDEKVISRSMRPAIVALKSQSDPVKHISNGNHKAK